MFQIPELKWNRCGNIPCYCQILIWKSGQTPVKKKYGKGTWGAALYYMQECIYNIENTVMTSFISEISAEMITCCQKKQIKFSFFTISPCFLNGSES